MKGKYVHWGGVLLGGSFITAGILLAASDGNVLWRGGSLPPWLGWVEIIGGTIVLIIAIHASREGKPEQKTYTPEEISQAEAEMDALYFKEHGELPEKPKRTE